MATATSGSTRWTDSNGTVWVTVTDYAAAHELDAKALARYVRKTEGVGTQVGGKGGTWVLREDAKVALPTAKARSSGGRRIIVTGVPVVNGAPDPEVIAFLISKGCKVRDPAADHAEAKRLAAIGAATEADLAAGDDEEESNGAGNDDQA